MKTFLRGLILAALMIAPAFGAENLGVDSRTNGTVWRNGNGEIVGVGPSTLFITMTDMSDPATAYIISPMRAVIQEVMTILQAGSSSTVTTGGANVVTVLVAKAASQAGSDGTAPLSNFKQLTGWTTVNLSIAQGSSASQTDTMGLASYATPSKLINNTVDQYGVIAVNTDGGNSDIRPLTIMIKLAPY